ncbi:MAG: 3-isopropylmalate dehydratase [Zestosphaera tikiterensis]|uniref:3-isopropylmalate dehydratase small subunit n=1 Tax=Zestosphaera tikiterensis TaxID=1973259 RepID=A0A2R7Y7C6_9CREN|nr:MAG: 3-isopropylmalate dehydratase [Zestosphaera tikiterensis]
MSSEVIKGKVLVVGDNIDTDLIVPGKYLTLKEASDLGKHVLEGLDPSIPDKIEKEGIRVIVAGRNFGCGSSREHAVLAIIGAGIKAVVAESFARIFYRNAINRGLIVIEAKGLRNKVRDGDIITIDLDKHSITIPTGEEVSFKPLPEEVMKIIKAGGLIEYLKKQKETKEATR